MTFRRWMVAAGVCLLALPGAITRAQAADSSAKQASTVDPRDTLFLRARGLVLNGNGTRGRAIVDSALAAATGTPEYGNALYWRAALASTAADAERDYRRVIVEYPFSAHSGDALLALAQLEMARGERDAAITHLQRYLIQTPPHAPERVRAGIWLGRLLLETNQLARGCAVLLRTRSALGDTAVEIRNQVDYYAARCVGVDTAQQTPPARAPSPAAAPTASTARPAVSAARPAAGASSVPKHDSAGVPNVAAGRAGKYTVQVAAYDTKAAAQRLVARLGDRGIVARVVGAAAPFRVRVGHFATSAEATDAVRQLKTKGIEAFVTTTDHETEKPGQR